MITLTKGNDTRIISAYHIIDDTVVLEWGAYVSFMKLSVFNTFTIS
jgi:hypothetical protein